MSDNIATVIGLPNVPDASLGFSKLKEKRKFLPSLQWKNSNTLIGMEIEIEGIQDTVSVGIEYLYNKKGEPVENLRVWRNVEDGSLRNYGREFVSYPVAGEDIEFALDILNNHLESNKETKGYEFTDRTSVHVHMNVLDMTIEELLKLLLVYISVEPVMYNFCGGNRHKNVFCVPVNQTGLCRNLGKAFSSKTRDSVLRLRENWRKYLGFNILPFTTLGTVEYRQMVGTNDIKKLHQWINMIFGIKDYAISHTFQELQDEILSLNTSSEYSNYLFKVFGYENNLMFESVERRMEEMVLFLKTCFSYDEVNNTAKEFVRSLFYPKSHLVTLAARQKLVKLHTAAKPTGAVKKTKIPSPPLNQHINWFDMPLADGVNNPAAFNVVPDEEQGQVNDLNRAAFDDRLRELLHRAAAQPRRVVIRRG
jgi:hypothetical protein